MKILQNFPLSNLRSAQFLPVTLGVPTLCFGEGDEGGGDSDGDGGTAVAEAPEGAPEPGEQPITGADFVDRIPSDRDALTERPNFDLLKKKPETKPLETAIQPEVKTGERARGADGKFIKTAAEKAAEERAQKPASAPQDPKKVQTPTAEVKTPPAATEKKPLPTPDDVDKMELPPGSSEKAVTNFQNMRTQLKEAVSAVKEHAAKLAAIEAENKTLKEKGGDPEKLKEYEEAVKFRQTWEAGNHPKFQAEWAAKTEQADKTLTDFLTNWGAKPEAIEKLKSAGINSEEGKTLIQQWCDAFEGAKEPLARRQLEQLALNRIDVDAQREAALKKLETDKESFIKELQGRDQADNSKWIKAAEEHAQKLNEAKGYKWARQMAHAESETPEQKALVDAHNENYTKMEGEFRELVGKLYTKDPEATMKVLHGYFDAEDKARELAEVRKELDEVKAREKQLNEHLGKVRKAGRTSQVESGASPEGGRTVRDTDQIGGDGQRAFESFFGGKR